MKTIEIPPLIWMLGKPEQWTQGGVTRTVRPLYYRAKGQSEGLRVGTIDPDYAELLMAALDKSS
jgi:hypothetical protein